MKSNYRAALDAGIARPLQINAYLPGASERGRWPKP